MMRRIVVSFILLMSTACSPTVDLESERAAVRALWDETNAALAAKDWDRYQAVWHHDPALKVIHPAQADWIDGWEAFRERYRGILTSDVTFSVETTRFDVEISPHGDMAWATIQADLFVNGVPSTQWYVMGTKKIDGQWRIVLALDAPSPEVPDGGA